MDHFTLKQGMTYCEDIPLETIAKEVGTPVYVYSTATLRRHCLRLRDVFSAYPTQPCFAVKANSNIAVLKEIFAAGFGADIVSVGELERALLAGAATEKIVFSGVGKTDAEIKRALAVGVSSFNVESAFELEAISAIAGTMKKVAPISLRINPDIDAKTNPKIATGLYSTKFGLSQAEAVQLIPKIKADKNLKLIGLACHIGSQMTEIGPLREAAKSLASMAQELKAQGHALQTIDMGGGLGIRYKQEDPPDLEAYAEALIAAVRPTGLKLMIEPGRVVVGNAGVLLTKVIGVKATPKKNFLIVDAAMTELIRPSLYDAYHEILPVKPQQGGEETYDVVGPVCESGDILGIDRRFGAVRAGELVYVRGCGAYASAMASNYNSRPRAPEVLVNQKTFRIVRRRETLDRLWELEEK